MDKRVEAMARWLWVREREALFPNDKYDDATPDERGEKRLAAGDAIERLEAAGYAVVPVEPTELMKHAGHRMGLSLTDYFSGGSAALIYTAMIQATKENGDGAS